MVPGSTAGTVVRRLTPVPPDPMPPDSLLTRRGRPGSSRPAAGGRELHEGVREDDPMRMVACDLDGTIVRADGTVSPRTVAALAACERAGVRVVFVTGRPPRWMAPVAAATGHHGIAVCANGAIVYDLAAERVITTRGIPSRGRPPRRPGRARRRPRRSLRPRDRRRLPPRARVPSALAGLGRGRRAAGGAARRRPVVLKMLYRLEQGAADDMLAAARARWTGWPNPSTPTPPTPCSRSPPWG